MRSNKKKGGKERKEIPTPHLSRHPFTLKESPFFSVKRGSEITCIFIISKGLARYRAFNIGSLFCKSLILRVQTVNHDSESGVVCPVRMDLD